MKTDMDIFEIYRGERGVGSGKSLFESGVIETPKNKRILEVGFGMGILARHMIENGNFFYGIDVGEESIKGAIQDNFIDRGTFLYMDASRDKLPFIDDFFDQVYMLETIEHLANPIHAIYEIKRVLKRDGVFILQFPRYEEQGYNAGNHAHVYPGLLAKEPFERFMMQLYFKKEKYMVNGSSAIYVYKNKKDEGESLIGQPDIFKVVAGNYNDSELYGHLEVEKDFEIFDLTKMKKQTFPEGIQNLKCSPCNRSVTPITVYGDDSKNIYICSNCSRTIFIGKK